jgi:NAD(P)-dependent dehydrogenase (short-subunit alcohol dehydrogenase family)
MKSAVLVTGAAGGVGLELVKLLAAADYKLIAIVLNEEEAGRVRGSVPADTRIVQVDLSDADRVGPALKPIFAAPGFSLDAAVTCAAIWPGGPLETTPLEEFRRTFEINTLGCVAIYQQCLPWLRRSKGRLILVSSISGRVALPFNGAYTLSKYAIEALGDTARREARKWGVQVSIVEPGPIKTPMVTAMAERLDRDRQALSGEARSLYGDLYDAFAQMVAEGYPVAAEPQIVAQTIMTALTAAVAETRYPVGDIAKSMLDMARTMPDRDLDAVAISSVTARQS